MDLLKIGNYIHKKRKEQKITQEQLGNKLGVSFQAVSNWERGDNLPDSSYLIDLSVILNTTVDSILKGGFERDEHSKKIIVRDIIKGVNYLSQIKNLLGEDNTVYKYMIEGVSAGMNTDFEEILNSNYLCEFLVIEILLQNVYSGHYVDQDEVKNLLQYNKTKEMFFSMVSNKPDNFDVNDILVNKE